VKALGYSGTFENGLVVDRYFTVFAPPVTDALARMQPGPAAAPALALVPEGVVGLTYLRIESPGQAFESLLAAVSSSVDAGTALVLGQVAIELRRSYGVEPDRPVSPALGDEVLFVDFGEGQPLAAIFAAKDSTSLLPVAESYLRSEGARMSTETHGGVEILRSSAADGRAVAFVDGYALVATRDQIARLVDARRAGGRGAEQARRALERSPGAVLVSQRDDREGTVELFLALSEALRGSGDDSGPLDPSAAESAFTQLAPAATAAEPRNGGLYAESHSAVGNFTYLTALLGGDDER
jgi:hypothetical protein